MMTYYTNQATHTESKDGYSEVVMIAFFLRKKKIKVST